MRRKPNFYLDGSDKEGFIEEKQKYAMCSHANPEASDIASTIDRIL